MSMVSKKIHSILSMVDDRMVFSVDASNAFAGVREICNSILTRPGKKIRPYLVCVFGEVFGSSTVAISDKTLSLYAWAAEAVHVASLLHDDVLDEAEVRRALPSVNQIYGNHLAVLAGDYLLSIVLERLTREGSSKLVQLLLQAIQHLCAGECLQYKMQYQVPSSIDVYTEIASRKTTSLFRWCAQVGFTLSNIQYDNESHIQGAADGYQFVDNLGLLFQWADDFVDVWGGADKTAGKTGWSDLRCGKLNLVTWEWLQTSVTLREEVTRDFAANNVSERLLAVFQRASACEQRQKRARQQILKLAEDTLSVWNKIDPHAKHPAMTSIISDCVHRCGAQLGVA